MKIAISSIAGPPDNPGTWSNAPAHFIQELERRGHTCIPVDSSCLTKLDKAIMAARNIARFYPWNAVTWLEPARRKRGRYVAQAAQAAGCDLIMCTGTLDAPIGQGTDYAIWLDNTFALLQRSAVALPFSTAAVEEIERLERIALNGACLVLPFSKHVRDSIVEDYDVPHERVHAVGCGAGSLPPFEGEKDFSKGHLLFVAKHLFSAKGGDLVLEAFRMIRMRRPRTKLVLIGNDEARAKAAGMDGVEVHGFIEREVLNSFFYAAAMLVQPMLADPWGQVYLEAMKARAVVIGLDVAALPELTDGGRLGVLVDAPDPRQLADAVMATFDRPQAELDAMTREAQRRVINLHSWETVGALVTEALDLKGMSGRVGQADT
jgi:glycosyltransferase involved in cell wall biosynthesis